MTTGLGTDRDLVGYLTGYPQEVAFGDEEAERAVETGHSTAREAASVAADAGVGTLLLTHFSARYSRDASELGVEAKQVFERTIVGRDGMELEIPYRT